MKLIDKYGRQHNYLRVSVTDKCNLNCIYCNPISSLKNGSKNQDLLSFTELAKLIEIFVRDLGFDKIRLTGGEPFARTGIYDFIKQLNGLKNQYPFELVATTNGLLIGERLQELKTNGLDRINFSLDSLNKKKFQQITGFDGLTKVLNTIENAISIGYHNTKINVVVMRGINDNEILDFVEFAGHESLNLRFIEYMPFSGNGFNNNYFISASEIRKIIETKFELIVSGMDGESVSKDYAVKGTNATIGFISSMSEHFCDSCNRLRLSSTGILRNCLFSVDNDILDIRSLIRNNSTETEIISAVSEHLFNKNLIHLPIDKLIELKNNNMLQIGG